MAKQTKRKFEKRPELDRNNVAYYKTKVDSNVEYDKEVDRQVKIEPKEDKTQHEKPESWSQIAKRGLNQLEPMKTKNQTMRIKPAFTSVSTGYDRIVITPTHFNNKPFKGFVTEKEAEIISKAIGLKESENHHGTSFYRNEKDELFITYRLKHTMSHEEILSSINKYFWFDKVSKVGNLDKISGQVVHPQMGEDMDRHQEEVDDDRTKGARSGNLDDTKDVRIDGCNYEISEHELRKWIELYGEIKSDIDEIAQPGESEEEAVGTGSYTIKVKLKRSIPNILPIGGLRVKFTYNGVKKQCKNCYEYHRSRKSERNESKPNYTCEKKSYEQYVEIFTENNPQILKSIADYKNQSDDSYESDENSRDYVDEMEEGNDNTIDYSFNYENPQFQL